MLILFPILLISGAILISVKCSPGDNNVDVEWLQVCIHNGLKVGVWTGSWSILSDIILFVLPLPVIFKLQVPMKKRIGLAVVFMTALL